MDLSQSDEKDASSGASKDTDKPSSDSKKRKEAPPDEPPLARTVPASPEKSRPSKKARIDSETSKSVPNLPTFADEELVDPFAFPGSQSQSQASQQLTQSQSDASDAKASEPKKGFVTSLIDGMKDFKDKILGKSVSSTGTDIAATIATALACESSTNLNDVIIALFADFQNFDKEKPSTSRVNSACEGLLKHLHAPPVLPLHIALLLYSGLLLCKSLRQLLASKDRPDHKQIGERFEAVNAACVELLKLAIQMADKSILTRPRYLSPPCSRIDRL